MLSFVGLEKQFSLENVGTRCPRTMDTVKGMQTMQFSKQNKSLLSNFK